MVAVMKSPCADGKQWQQQGRYADHPEDIPATLSTAFVESDIDMPVTVIATIFVAPVIHIIVEILTIIFEHMIVAHDAVEVIAVFPVPVDHEIQHVVIMPILILIDL
jgi:hypothetical protein